jgi:long-chain acyl-CoA synthetase
LIFIEDQDQYEKIKSIWSNCPSLKNIVILDNSDTGDTENVYTFNSFIEIGIEYSKLSDLTFDLLVNTAAPTDLLTLIYTSGTTGNPKGVMLSHENLIANMEGIGKLINFETDDVFLSFLPLSHVFERMGGHFTAFSRACTVYYAEGIEQVPANLQEVRPTIVLSVPRLYEKMHARIVEGLKSAPAARQKIFWWAIDVGRNYSMLSISGKKIPFILAVKHKIANKLVYSKVRERMGGRLKFFVSGGAPLSQAIGEFFAAAGITILEGYGLTETSPVLSSNSPEALRYGSVGKPLFNVEIKIDTDGEILAKGLSIMKGYYNNEEATKEAIDSEGWFHTGDIGEFDDDGYLKITDRKKNILVTSGGKNIAPAPMENVMVASPYIEQVVVIGDKRNFISALIVPAFESIESYLIDHDKAVASHAAIVEHSDVIALIGREVNKAMESFSKYERVKKFTLLPRLLTLEKGELTPTLKVVRRIVLSNFDEYVNSMYSDVNNKNEEEFIGG